MKSAEGFGDPCVGEALCFREVLSWMKEIQVTKVIFEFDGLILVDALGQDNLDLSHFDLVVKDYKALL